MSGIDQLLANSFEKIMQINLGVTTVDKIRTRLFEKYGMSITESMNEFEKLDSILREFFGAGAVGLERKFLDSLCSAKSKKDQNRLTITDSSISQSILKAYGDDESSKILNASIDKSHVISELLEKLEIPKTSGYRKTNSLIEDGLLIKDGYELAPNGRKIDKYKSLCDNVQIDIKNNKVIVNASFTQDVFGQSSILQKIYGI
jgi:hypothetical protein